MKKLSAFVLTVLSIWLLGLTPGDKAPNFSTVNQDGKTVSLSQLKGKAVLLYFYPKDDTPGCTIEANQLKERFADFQAHGAIVIGISRQDSKSHAEFRKKYSLPFDLWVDEKGDIAKAFGVDTYPVVGLHRRESFLISGEGKIVKHYGSVDPKSHAEEVLKDLGKLTHP